MTIAKISVFAAALALAGGAASANSFGFQENVDDGAFIEVNRVVADSDGVLEIYNLQAGEQGVLLGSSDVNAGANEDLLINVGNGYKTDVLAVLKVDGQIVAIEEFDVSR